MSARDIEIDLFSGSVELKGVFACGENWSWFAPSMGATWSWRDVFTSQGFALSVTFKDVRIYSDIARSSSEILIAFVPHVQQWLKPSSFPIKISIETFFLEGWGIFFESNRPFAERLLSVIHCQLSVAKKNGEWQTKVALADGGVWCGTKEQGRSRQGTLLFCAPLDRTKPKHLHSVLAIRVPALSFLVTDFKFSLDYKAGVWSYLIENAEKIKKSENFLDTLSCEGTLVQKENKIESSGVFYACGLKQASFNCVFDQEQQLLDARCNVIRAFPFFKRYRLSELAAESSWSFVRGEKQRWKLSGIVENDLKNKKMVKRFPVVLCGSYDRGILRTACSSLGSFLSIKEASFWQGFLTGQLRRAPQGLLVKLKVENGQIPIPGTYIVLSEASCSAVIDVKNKKIEHVCGEVKTTRGTCAVARGSLAWDQKRKQWYVFLPWRFYASPFGFSSALSLNVFGSGVLAKRPGDQMGVRGLVTLEKGCLQGNIFSALFIERLLGRIFYGADLESMHMPQPKSFGSALRSFLASAEFDVQVATEQPLEVKIPLLSGFLKGRLRVQGSLGFPSIKGSFSLVNGIVHLPYRPLLVKQGDILFDMPRRPIPDIFFVASNTIKRHNVSLCAQGPLDSPRISVKSDPELDVRCCATLLTGGSVNGTPALAYSASFKQLIHELFFADVFPEGVRSDFSEEKSWLSDVSFISRLGSGLERDKSDLQEKNVLPGTAAGVTVEYGDRWSASIEKNVDLPTATTAEVAYHLSPESLVFINRNELGLLGIGGEWAHRWEN